MTALPLVRIRHACGFSLTLPLARRKANMRRKKMTKKKRMRIPSWRGAKLQSQASREFISTTAREFMK